MANREELETLRLFVAKAERLLASSFLRQAEQGLGWTLSGEKDQPVSLEIRGPSWESVEAFVLNLRFFIQYNEPISIASMEKIFSGTAATPEQRKTYHEERQKLNDYLGKSSMFQINGSKITNRDVMDLSSMGTCPTRTPRRSNSLTSG